MERNLRENVLAWLLYPTIWLAGHAYSIRDVIALESTGNWWLGPYVRLLLIGGLVQITLWFLDLSARTRGWAYVVAMLASSSVWAVWESKRVIQEIGWGPVADMTMSYTPYYLLSGVFVLGTLALLRHKTSKAI